MEDSNALYDSQARRNSIQYHLLKSLPEHEPLAIFTISFSAHHFPSFSDDSGIIGGQSFWFDFSLTATHSL
jgi:hypothetical protein